mgnify:FL=1|tara:strand:- start:791 stop:1645 length:855 start_codon:yes stop_codon:yes gene_type:complete
MLKIGPDTYIYENYQEVEYDWHNYEFSNANANIPNNWKLEIANALMVYEHGYSEYYQEYLPMDLWENPRFIYEAYNTIISNLDTGFNFPATISDKVVNSPEFFKILSIAPQCLENLYFRQYKQIEFFKKIIQTNSAAFQYCLPRIQKSHTYVLEAVKINGHCLEHVAFNLKADKTIVTTALNNTPYAIRHAQKKLANDPKYFVDAITKCIEEDDSQPIHQYPFDDMSTIHENFWSGIYTNKQLEKMVVKFKDKKIRSRLYEIWKNRTLENDVLLLANMKKRFLG